MAYHLEGQLLELCTCGTYCPCRAAGETDGSDCDAVNVWHIDKGTINETDVAGLTLVALSHVHGHVLEGRPVVYYVDDAATDEQQEALLAVWTGHLGGPVADVARLIGDVVGVERAPITFSVDRIHGSLKVGETLNVREVHSQGAVVPSEVTEGAPTHEAVGHAPSRYGDVCTTIPGSETTVGQAAVWQVKTREYGFDIDLRDHKVIQGRFHFDG